MAHFFSSVSRLTLASTLLGLLIAVGGVFSVSGCSRSATPSAEAAAPQPLPVEVQEVAAGRELLVSELPGRVTPQRVAEIRSRVTGVILKRHFREGAEVQEGDTLFTVDPAPFQAALAQAQGELSRAEAQLEQATILVGRYEKLEGANAISRQDFEDAVTARSVAAASLQSARAAVRTAQLDLDYSSVKSPISGRVGVSYVTEGALVVANDAVVMARVQPQDPVYVDVFQSAEAITKRSEAVAAGGLSLNDPVVGTVTVMTDGSERSAEGRVLFTDNAVDTATGQVAVRAEVANADGWLKPGMFVRVRLVEAVDTRSVFLPQRAVLRGPTGAAKVWVVGKDNLAEEREVVTGLMRGSVWQITAGLNAGDRVVVTGVDRIAPGTPLEAKAVQSATR